MKKILAAMLCALLLAGCAADPPLYYLPKEETETSVPDAFVPAEHQLCASPFSYTESSDRPASNPGNAARRSYLNYSDGDFFFLGKTMYRYHTASGNLTTLCLDPLCTHSEDCPFWMVNPILSLYVHDGAVNYRQTYQKMVQSMGKTRWEQIDRKMRFDMKSLRAEVVFDYVKDDIAYSGARAADEYYTGKYRYFLHHVLDDAGKLNYELRREDLGSGEEIVLLQLGDTPSVVLYADEMWVYYHYAGQIWRMRTDEKTREPEALRKMILQDTACDGEHFYFRIRERNAETGEDEDRIWRYDMLLENGECIVAEDTVFLYLTQEYLYYNPGERARIGENEFATGNTIYRRRKSDGKTECVFSLPGEMRQASYALSQQFAVCGNYIYAGYTYPDGGEIRSAGGRDLPELIRIDITTGEIYYIVYE